MLDPALLRKDLDAVVRRLASRGFAFALESFNALEARRKAVQTETETLQAQRNALAKQIGALVKTIQTDTQDAVAAMERSTQGVVESTKLSDAAGSALTDIDRVTRELADLIERTDSRKVTGGKDFAKTGELKGVLRALDDAGALNSLGRK